MAYSYTEKKRIRKDFSKLKPVMDEAFPLADAAKAHAHMEAGDHIGKIVLIVE